MRVNKKTEITTPIKFKKISLFLLAISLFVSSMSLPSYAEDYSCLQPPETFGTEPTWKTSETKDLKFVISWAFKDPEKCILGMDEDRVYGNNLKYPKDFGVFYQFPTSWKVSRDGEMALVSAETEIPLSLLQSLRRIDNSTSETNFYQTNQGFSITGYLKLKRAGSFASQYVDGKFGLAQLWGNWFSKNQGIFSNDCKQVDLLREGTNIGVDWKILNPGTNPKVEISLSEKFNCIFLVHAAPISTYKVSNKLESEKISLAEYPFWEGQGSLFFNDILSKPNQIVQVALGDFTSQNLKQPILSLTKLAIVEKIPENILSHEDSIVRSNNVVKIISTIDGSKLNSASKDIVTIYVGIYHWYYSSSSYVPSGWNVTFSGNTWTARYSKGGSVPGGNFMVYSTRAIKIPISDLFISSEEKAAAELKAKQEAEVKAAAELKAKQEAEAKATADKIAAIKAAAEAAADARAAEIKAEEEAAAKAAASKKITITCVKGKLTKKVTAIRPVCPSGYKKK